MLKQFVAWFRENPRQSNSSIRHALNLRHNTQVDNFLSQLEFQSDRGRCPLIGRANVQLYTFVAIPEKPKPAIKTIRERRRHENSQTAANSDKLNQLIHQPTVEPMEMDVRCETCDRIVTHTFERVAVVGRESVVKATCKVCGKETTK